MREGTPEEVAEIEETQKIDFYYYFAMQNQLMIIGDATGLFNVELLWLEYSLVYGQSLI